MAIHQEVAGRVLVVTIDNPAVKNAFDRETITALSDLFGRPHVIVLRATGDVFCSGAHLGEMKEMGEADFQENLAAALDMGGMFRAVRSCPAPVVARVQGPAFGGGVGLVAACDVVVASFRVRFSFSEVRLGLVPGVISPLVMDRIGQAAT